MAFHIASSTSAHRKLEKRIDAFADNDDDDDDTGPSIPAPPPTAAAAHPAQASSTGTTTAIGPQPGSKAAAGASAEELIERGSTYASQGNSAAALQCWHQALLVGLTCCTCLIRVQSLGLVCG